MTHLYWNIYHWCFRNGVPGNTVASALWIGVGVMLDHYLIKPARKRRQQLQEEIHRLLHHEHEETARKLGQTPHGGWVDTQS